MGNKEVDADDLIFTGVDEGEKVQFIPITDSTRRYVGIQFGLMDEDFNDMPNYVFGGYGIGIKPPKQVFTVGADGNCFFRAVCFILSGTEEKHFEVRQSICDYIEVHYRDLEPFCEDENGKIYLEKVAMRENAKWGTEIEILATAHMSGRDVIVYNHTGYLRYKSWNSPTAECFFIDNRAGGHFNVVKAI